MKKTTFKKCVLVLMSVFCFLGLQQNVSAEVKDNNRNSGHLLNGLSTNNPEMGLSKGTSIPTSTHNVYKSDYYLGGENKPGNVLYTEKRLFGKGDTNKYYISIKNTGISTVRVMAKREQKTYLDFNVNPGKTVNKSFDNIYKSTEWYLRFSSAGYYAIEGSVK